MPTVPRPENCSTPMGNSVKIWINCFMNSTFPPLCRCNIHSHFITVNGESRPCPYLPLGSTPSDKNIYGQTFVSRERQFEQMSERILDQCSDKIDSIEVIYQCKFEKLLKMPGNDVYKFFNSPDQSMTVKKKPPPPLSPPGWAAWRLRGGIQPCGKS